MPDKSKITLSAKERSLVTNVEWILTKQAIIQKVYDLFAGNIAAIKHAVLDNKTLSASVRLSVPKIFKGENYLQLPYVIMDYPRCFDKENIFAIRTMFWWGNFFSITLHLAGEYKNIVKENLYNGNHEPITDLYIGVNENQWQHHFEQDNFLPYTRFGKQQRIELFEKNNFIKLALKFELEHWNNMPDLFAEGYKSLAGILFNYPNGETDL